MNIFNVLGNVLYFVYDTTMLGCISIIFPFESIETKMTLHKLCISNCNNYCNDICYDITWKTVEIITCIQIFYKKTVVPGFHKITNNYFRNINEVLLIKNGEEINRFKTWELFESVQEYEDFDLLLYTKYSETECKKNYTIICEPALKNKEKIFSNKCDVNFIIFQLTTDNNKYDINLKEPQNFFVKDNVLKYTFFKWYMKKVYDVNLTEEFSINYMTQDMSIANLHNPFYIKFNEDGVTSFSTGKPKPLSINVSALTDSDEITNDLDTVDTIETYQKSDNVYINIINSERLKEHCE